MGSDNYGTIGYNKKLGGIRDKAHYYEEYMLKVIWIGRSIAIQDRVGWPGQFGALGAHR